MKEETTQGVLFSEPSGDGGATVFINARCSIKTQDDFRVVLLAGLPLHYYAMGDRVTEAYAMVMLVEQGLASQKEVAQAFCCTTRTVRRHQERFEQEGMSALGRGSGHPTGKPRVSAARTRQVNKLKSQGLSNREIARRVGVSEKAIRKQLRRLGWKHAEPEQLSLDLESGLSADPNLSGGLPETSLDEGKETEEATCSLDESADPNLSGGLPEPPMGDREEPREPTCPLDEPADPNLSGGLPEPPMGDREEPREPTCPPDEPADPNLSGIDDEEYSEEYSEEYLMPSIDDNPADRRFDRLMAYLGLLMDARPIFQNGTRVAGAGVLLAIPAIVDNGVLSSAREVYGNIGPAFFGLRTTVLCLVLMALLRIKRPEGLKEHSPQELGRIFGLDRAPEVKTLRRKLTRLAAVGRSVEFGRELAKRRAEAVGEAVGFLYVDGHVRVYHGKRPIPKTHAARVRLPMPGTTDYWLNDAKGDPLFVVTAEANAGLVKMLPEILAEVRSLLGDRRITIVFDRGGYSPKLFAKLIDHFDILTYRKGKSRKVPRSRFTWHEALIDGQKVRYQLADQTVLLLKRKLRLRQVTRLSPNGHQTQILTSRRDLDAIEVAYRMFSRWRQENFFKYLREEYAIDALVDYKVEPDDEQREVPNPRWKQLDAELRKARAELKAQLSQYGIEAFANVEEKRRTMRGFKIANAKIAKEIEAAQRKYIKLRKKRDAAPKRVPVKQVVKQEVVKLATERKHITSLLKMAAYQVESDLLRMLSPHYARAEDEGRTLIQTAMASAADIEVSQDTLHIRLAPLSSAHRSKAIAALCAELNQKPARFPGTKLRLRFSVASAG